MTVGSVFVFRARGKLAAYRTPGYPVTPLVFIALSLWTVYNGVAGQLMLSLEIVAVLARAR